MKIFVRILFFFIAATLFLLNDLFYYLVMRKFMCLTVRVNGTVQLTLFLIITLNINIVTSYDLFIVILQIDLIWSGMAKHV